MASIIEKLQKVLGPDKVISGTDVPHEHRHDYWFVSNLRELQERGAPRPLCVARPSSTKDVQQILKAAQEAETPVIPFGLGSGVCGGVIADAAGIMLDMSAMKNTIAIDETNFLATFEAGKNGLEAEEEVAALGLTIGHWPQSIAISSVGGWVATRASGQFSTAYGNIEDILYSVEAVLPNGDIITAGKAPRAAAGPDLRHLLLGSEGTLAVITKVTFSLRRAAAAQAYSAFYATTMAAGFEAQRQMIQGGWKPPVMRQYDHPEVARNFNKVARGEDALLILVHEGPDALVQLEKAAVAEIAAKCGLDAAPESVVPEWMEHRNKVPSWDQFIKNKIVVDTIEVSAPWTHIDAVYQAAIASLRAVENILNASAHSSHVYRSGINLYFSFAAVAPTDEAMEALYSDCWKRVIEATAATGGGIAHHHGIGRVRQNYLPLDLGETGISLLRTVKTAIDPNNIMNPGVLLPHG
jgi:alkyldihydroxyacetonephosphate synthase